MAGTYRRTGSQSGSSGSRTVTSKTANYTAADREIVLANATGGAFTVTLPAATSGALVTVKKTDGSAYGVAVAPASGTIDGAGSLLISAQYDSYDVVSDGTNWFVV